MRKCSAFLSLFLVFLVGTDFRSAAQTQPLSLLRLHRSITGLSPSFGFVGTSVTISGSNFGSAQGSSVVTFNGTAASVTNWTNSSIIANVPLRAASGNVVVTVNGSASNGVHFDVVTSPPGVIARSNFGFQCGPGSGNCPDQSKSNPPTPLWPTSVAQPGTLRLWDSQVSWSYLMTGYSGGVGTYNWAQLDGYLNDIAAHQPINVNYVFACVPAFIASGVIGTTPGSCGNGTPQGSASPPNDLAPSGSPAFTQFVTDLMNHCSAAGNCVKNLITGYELWNEANVSSGTGARWAGTQLQLYQMVAPAVKIIHAQNPNALNFHAVYHRHCCHLDDNLAPDGGRERHHLESLQYSPVPQQHHPGSRDDLNGRRLGPKHFRKGCGLEDTAMDHGRNWLRQCHHSL